MCRVGWAGKAPEDPRRSKRVRGFARGGAGGPGGQAQRWAPAQGCAKGMRGAKEGGERSRVGAWSPVSHDVGCGFSVGAGGPPGCALTFGQDNLAPCCESPERGTGGD